MVERILFGAGGASEVTLAAVLVELAQKLEAGQAVALDAPTLAALESITATISGSVAVTGPLTDTQLRAAAVPVSGTVATGALTDTQLRAAGVNVADSGEREYTHVTASVTASGNTTIHTPAAGKAIRLHWISAGNDPTAATPSLIKVKLGADEYYRVWELSKRQRITGAVNAALVINLSAAGNVAVTAVLEEI